MEEKVEPVKYSVYVNGAFGDDVRIRNASLWGNPIRAMRSSHEVVVNGRFSSVTFGDGVIVDFRLRGRPVFTVTKDRKIVYPDGQYHAGMDGFSRKTFEDPRGETITFTVRAVFDAYSAYFRGEMIFYLDEGFGVNVHVDEAYLEDGDDDQGTEA